MQQVPSPDDATTVTDEAAAKVLLDADARRWFLPFLARASSVGAAAAALGEKPNSVLYRVRRWLELGLVEVRREELRRGRVVRHYRSTADAFFVPHGASSSESLVALLRHVNEPYLEELYRGVESAARTLSPDWGVRVSRAGDVAKIEAATSPDAAFDPSERGHPAVLERFTRLQLDFEDAKAFQLELLALLRKYGSKRGAQAYASYLALAPLADAR